MTPWLAERNPRKSGALLDEAIKSCPKLTEIVIAGQDVTDQIFLNLCPTVRLTKLGITDFVRKSMAISAHMNNVSGTGTLNSSWTISRIEASGVFGTQASRNLAKKRRNDSFWSEIDSRVCHTISS